MGCPSILRVALLAIFLAGVAPALAPAPAAARAPACPDRHHVTVGDLVDLSRYGISFGGPNRRAHACFGGKIITIHAFANWPDGIGGTSASGVRPGEFEWPQLYLFSSSQELARGYGKGSFYGIVVPPRFGRVEKTYHRVWVDVTARFEHPYADRCRGYGPRGMRPTRAEAVAQCRDTLVMVSIRAAAGPPDTARATAPAGPGSPGSAWALLVPAALLGAWAGWRRGAALTGH